MSACEQHSIHRIVITGAPASGKTELILRLQSEPFCREFIFLSEVARALLTESPAMRQNWGAFHREVYRRQVAQENKIQGQSFISDRGTVDAFAFHRETATQIGTTIENEYQRYSAVFQLGTAAALGKTYYVQDDIRTESIEDALIIQKATSQVWKDHPGYQWIAASNDIEIKYEELCQHLRQLTA